MKISTLPKGKIKVNLGTYLRPEKIGFLGWIQDRQSGEVIFIDLEGRLCRRNGKKINTFIGIKRKQGIRIPFNPSSR